MNKKGQFGIGAIIVLAIAIIIGLILFQPIAGNVEQGTRTNSGDVDVVNRTITWGAVNNVQELTGQELVGTPVVTNKSNVGVTVSPTNYTVYECVRTSDNLKGICLKTVGNPATDPNMGTTSNISYSYYPAGYIDDAGARSIAGIIVLLTAVAIFLIVLAGNKFDF